MLTGLQPTVLGAQAELRWSDVGPSCPVATYLQGSMSPEQDKEKSCLRGWHHPCGPDELLWGVGGCTEMGCKATHASPLQLNPLLKSQSVSVTPAGFSASLDFCGGHL